MISKHFTISFAVLIFWILSLWSCQNERNGLSTLQVTRGVKIPAEEYKAVVKLKIGWNGVCTGTFLNDHTIITAAHCMVGNIFLEVPGGNVLAPKKVFIPPMFHRIEAINPLTACEDFQKDFDTAFDFALMSFPQGTAQLFGIEDEDYFVISNRAPSVGDQYHFIGFGSSEATEKDGATLIGGLGTKRIGENHVEGFIGGNTQVILSNSSAYHLPLHEQRLQDNSSEGGDSGGPVFWPETKELIGILSSGLDFPACEYSSMSDLVFSVHSDWAQKELKSRL